MLHCVCSYSTSPHSASTTFLSGLLPYCTVVCVCVRKEGNSIHKYNYNYYNNYYIDCLYLVSEGVHYPDQVHSFHHLTKYHILAIQPAGIYILYTSIPANLHNTYAYTHPSAVHLSAPPLPTYNSILDVVMKNCEPFVLGP